MRIAMSGCLMAFLAVTHVTVARADGPSSDTEKAITALEEQWAQGEASNKPDQIAPLLGERFIITESDGEQTNRAGLLAEERENHYTSSQLEDIKVIVYGDAAIASYRLHQKYTSKGKAFDTRTRQTDTWVKGPSGAWQCVAAHGSKTK